jgi:putative ABC transport system permease protein
MRALNLKLLRDLGNMKGQATAVALVMACGLAVMIMARSLISKHSATPLAKWDGITSNSLW